MELLEVAVAVLVALGDSVAELVGLTEGVPLPVTLGVALEELVAPAVEETELVALVVAVALLVTL